MRHLPFSSGYRGIRFDDVQILHVCSMLVGWKLSFPDFRVRDLSSEYISLIFSNFHVERCLRPALVGYGVRSCDHSSGLFIVQTGRDASARLGETNLDWVGE